MSTDQLNIAERTSPRSIDGYRTLLAEEVAGNDQVRAWTAWAEAEERFPRAFIEHLGRTGAFADKWWGDGPTDVAKHIELGFSLGSLLSIGVSVGATLHDAGISILRRFGRSEHLRSVAAQAIRGEAVLCVAASEESGGSDLQIVETLARKSGDGYHIKGRKKFVSLSPVADHIVVVARAASDDPAGGHGNVMLFAVPTAQTTVLDSYRKVSAGPLDTAPVEIDTWVPDDMLIARPGAGIAAISWGMAHERLSLAAQIAAFCHRVLAVTVARMMERKQFGRTLFEHQALRLRVADLQARVDLLRHALAGIAAQGTLDLRTAAAMKVTSARLGEEVLSECMHIFGGSAYLVDETPWGRWWRDMKLARVGGGADEVLWELVAAGLKPDVEGYRALSALA